MKYYEGIGNIGNHTGLQNVISQNTKYDSLVMKTKFHKCCLNEKWLQSSTDTSGDVYSRWLCSSSWIQQVLEAFDTAGQYPIIIHQFKFHYITNMAVVTIKYHYTMILNLFSVSTKIELF